jgi:hypothetical protein
MAFTGSRVSQLDSPSHPLTHVQTDIRAFGETVGSSDWSAASTRLSSGVHRYIKGCRPLIATLTSPSIVLMVEAILADPPPGDKRTQQFSF